MRIFEHRYSPHRLRSAGQALVLIVITFFGLVIFLGLMIDLGQIFLAKGYLRRAADAAALAAAAQYRENRTIAEMKSAAEEVARMNGIDAAKIRVRTCLEGQPGPDTTLCTKPPHMPKKLVRVEVEMDYPLTFLRLIGINDIHLFETSVSEAASMDVVLVIDVGESMAWDIPSDPSKNYYEDPANPAVCNVDDSCLPFHNVKAAAESFAAEILNKVPGKEEDRLSVVTFANGWEAGSQGTTAIWGENWFDDFTKAQHPVFGIPSLKVYEASNICPLNNDMACGGPDPIACYPTVEDIPTGPCVYVGDQGIDPLNPGINQFWGYNCARVWDVDTEDGDHWDGIPQAISACTTTNIGGGLRRAGEQFAFTKRQEALWVVVLLTDGAANATYALEQNLDPAGGGTELITDPSFMPLDPALFVPNLPLGYCPDGTWIGRGTPPGYPNRMYCQDGRTDTYHSLKDDPDNYDADDFARDQAKFVACAAAGTPNESCTGTRGQGAVIFTIGLGEEITDVVDENPVVTDRKPYAGELLRYIAAIGDDGDADTDPCAGVDDYTQNCGNYFYAQESTDLDRVFELIYSRIFTRLTM